jgi:CheY-like chemotaxis protein
MVVDTGIGIAPENQAKVFEEFFQVRGPLQTRSKGTGLGLAHARRLSEILGGSLVLESEPGKGSSFAVTVPVHWNSAAGARSVPDEVDVARLPTLSVLIIDDDETFRTALRGMLQGLSQDVREVTGGAEALELLETFVPDVIFLDLWMPEMGGDEVLARLDEQPRLRDIPVAIVTSVDLGLERPAGLGRAHSLLAKSDITKHKVASVIASLHGADV